jgi:hypothetical protein
MVLAGALLSGCAATGSRGSAAGGGGAFSAGVFTTYYEKDVGTTYAATVKALTDLGMTIRKSHKDARLASILATRPDDMAPVEITLKEQRHGMTGAAIRVGQDGNEGYSRVVAKRIGARLEG